MRYGNDYQFMSDMPEGYINQLAVRTKRELLDNILSCMEYGKRYVIRIEKTPICNRGECLTAGFRVDIEECRTERVVLPTLEEVCLKPAETLQQRLKNCANYLRRGAKR